MHAITVNEERGHEFEKKKSSMGYMGGFGV